MGWLCEIGVCSVFGKELLQKTLRGETMSRVPWVPFVGVHGGALIGQPAHAYLRSAEFIQAGLSTAHERYRPDGLPIVFDLQLEAEVLGCELRWAEETPPAVVSHPLASAELEDLPTFDMSQGRFPIVLDALQRVRQTLGDQICLYGLVTGPFTIALHLLGNPIFLAIRRDPDRVHRLLDYCAKITQRAASGYLNHGADLIAVVDPMTSQISPAHFRTFVQPRLNVIFDLIRAMGGWSSLFICGDARRNLPDMFQSRCDNVSIDENVPLDLASTLATEHGRSFGGNLKLTTALLLGDRATVEQDVARCFAFADQPGYILAPGCDLPYATPPENLETVTELVHSGRREIAATSAATLPQLREEIRLPDYAQDSRVWIDVVTIDSAACPPCQYMVTAAEQVAQTWPKRVIVREHKITTPEGLAVQARLNVTNLPTICIDGVVRYVSEIPDHEAFAEELSAAVARKSDQ